jgi:hypothetical protein
MKTLTPNPEKNTQISQIAEPSTTAPILGLEPDLKQSAQEQLSFGKQDVDFLRESVNDIVQRRYNQGEVDGYLNSDSKEELVDYLDFLRNSSVTEYRGKNGIEPREVESYWTMNDA